VALRQQVLGRELAAVGVIDHDVRQPRMGGVDEHDRQAVTVKRVDLLVGERKRDDEQAVDPIALREVAQRLGALLRRLDVEEQEGVAAARQAPDHPAQALHDRRDREERGDDADPLRAAHREIARDGAGAEAELPDRRADALVGGRRDQRAVIEHARGGGDAHAGVAGHVANGGAARRACNRLHWPSLSRPVRVLCA
jgi:hypothetical protein